MAGAGLSHEASRRLHELKALSHRHGAGDERARPNWNRGLPGAARSDRDAAPASVFAADWIVLAHAGGDRPDLPAVAAVARRLREALMSAWPEQPPPEWLSGHAKGGAPAREPHLAIVPLADVGFAHSGGGVMGLAIVPPRWLAARRSDSSSVGWRETRALRLALAALAEIEQRRCRAEGTEPPAKGGIRLVLGRAGTWTLVPDEERRAAPLRPERYCDPARIFATATPIALDRHPKASGPAGLEEAAASVAASCERIGLPGPARVGAFKRSSFRGTPSAWAPGGSPDWRAWARPKSLAGRPLVHAVIEFDTAVRGPVILGAGRFFGLGLCLPLPESAT